jgi:hypothetical protein
MKIFHINMKQKRYSIFLVVLLFAACTTNTEEDISTGTVPLSLSAKWSANISMETKSSTELPANDSIGVYVSQKDTTIDASYFANQLYVADGVGNLNAKENVSLTIGRSYDIYAYAPYQTLVTDPTSVVFNHGEDVLWAPKNTITNVSATNSSAFLTFSHRGAQIAFKVVFACDYTIGSTDFTSDSKITVSGFYDTGTLNIETGVLTPGTLKTKVMSGVATGTTGSMTLSIDPTCFFPATSAMDLVVTVTHEGKNYNATISHVFATGSYTLYTVTLKGGGRTLDVTSTIVDWTPVAGQIEL